MWTHLQNCKHSLVSDFSAYIPLMLGFASLGTLEGTQIRNIKYLSICIFAHSPRQGAEGEENRNTWAMFGGYLSSVCPCKVRDKQVLGRLRVPWSLRKRTEEACSPEREPLPVLGLYGRVVVQARHTAPSSGSKYQ